MTGHGVESPEQDKARARRIAVALRGLYPEARCALDHEDPLQLLVATVLSAQCTDERVNRVTPGLFARYPDAGSYAAAQPVELEEAIRSTGFFRNKARSLRRLGAALVQEHDSRVPERMEQLVRLPGVGRKTANVLLGSWYGQPAIPVDTHVTRLAGRLALSTSRDPVKIERDLQQLLPRNHWTATSHALILHGRSVCKARAPACELCALRSDCFHPTRA